MHTPIEVLEEEVEGQVDVLEKFGESRFPEAAAGSIFVGAGDSYAAALAAFYASRGRCIALDPYSLARSPETAKGLDVYLISVSGKTSANLLAARTIRGLARRTTAITADGSSKLAGLTDDIVRLPTKYAPKAPGMASFTLSLLAVLRIAKGEGIGRLRTVYDDASKARGFSTGAGTTYFLGNSLAYTAALYAAAKTYEFLGAKAHAELLEEFSHLELFSLRRSDAVNIFSSFDPSGAAPKLRKALTGAGFDARTVPTAGESDAEKLFHSIFVIQMTILRLARKAGLSRPSFLGAGRRLRVSDEMIY